MSTYIYNSSLPFVRSNFNGNRIWKGRFTNFPYPDPEPSIKKVLRWKFSKNPQQQEKKAEGFALDATLHPRLPEKDNYLLWLGHASFFIRFNGLNLLVDPVLGSLPLLKRKSIFPLPVESLQGIDYVLISHAHRDHFDIRSLKILYEQNPRMVVLGPLKIHRLLPKVHEAVLYQEAGWYQRYETPKELNISLLPAIHWHRHGLMDTNRVLWGSFLIENPQTNKRIFYAGDSAYGRHFKDIRDALGPMDVCLMPIGAYKPDWLMKGSHMTPQEAYRGFKDLQGKTFIPMHYGTFDLADEPLGEPLSLLHEIKEQAKDQQTIQSLLPGSVFSLE